jgi:hypothetical protein
MTIHEAYNKGLDDAENAIIKELSSLVRTNKMNDLQNPKLKELQSILSEWSDYFHTQGTSLTMTGKKHNRMLKRQMEQLDNNQI